MMETLKECTFAKQISGFFFSRPPHSKKKIDPLQFFLISTTLLLELIFLGHYLRHDFYPKADKVSKRKKNSTKKNLKKT